MRMCGGHFRFKMPLKKFTKHIVDVAMLLLKHD